MNRGQANLTMDLQVDVPRSVVISKHVVPLCNEAADSTYTRLHDINTWSSLPGKRQPRFISRCLRQVEHKKPCE
ncbi:unnamed protein product [Bemisia tabaci]|uniref:Out at first protein BRICHOS-like domain-containing protein n=1 Tax=Bemisia tabaci TaxID=7038 RepID=A0A9P0ABB3_BEMTA|nr:unnamed protein product [Bemisia tabaci]